MSASKVQQGDLVEVITGDDKGKRGRVLRVFPKNNKVLVEGVNVVVKHVRPSQKYPQGGRIHKSMPIDSSNVAVVVGDEKTGVKTRIRFEMRTTTVDGQPMVQKHRIAVKTGTDLGPVSRLKRRRKYPGTGGRD